MNLVQKLISRINEVKKRVLIIGDAVTDVWVHGRIEDCQDGCQKFVETSRLRLATPGGAANAEHSLIHWKADTRLFAWASNDRPVKTRYVDESGTIVFRHDNEEEIVERNRHNYEWLRTDAVDAIKYASAVLLSDYDKGFLTKEFIREAASKCVLYGIPCVADCKCAPEIYDGCMMKGNIEWSNKYRYYPNVLTRGSDLPIVVKQGAIGPFRYLADPNMKNGETSCVNHVGAGDCFAAHLTLALAYGFSLREAAALAHSAGRVYVQHAHNRPPRVEEIERDLVSIID